MSAPQGSAEDGRPPKVERTRTLFHLALGALITGAFYLLLIDTLYVPELYAAVFAVVVGAFGYEATREQGFAEVSFRKRLVWRLPRALLRVPGDLARLLVLACAQLMDPRSRRGVLRSLPFDHGGESSRDAGRRALAEYAGAISPNTIVIGVDPDRDLILAHQLRPSGGSDAIDVLHAG